MAGCATILCIDDDPDTLKLRKLLLESSGYSVLTVPSGSDGVDVARQSNKIDLVVLDYLMPGMAGDQVADELKRYCPDLPLVLISAVEQLPDGLVRKVDAYVQKGQDPEILLAVIGQLLSARPNSPAARSGEKKNSSSVSDDDSESAERA